MVTIPKIIKLPYRKPTDISWMGKEQEYVDSIRIVTNISEPSILIYSPDTTINTKTAVLIAPGGGLYANSIDDEGIELAQWLNKKGITAIVLKYRLVPTQPEKNFEAFKNKHTNYNKATVQKLFPFTMEDALTAMNYIRKQATELNINPNKIGMIGFSAGGALAMGVGYNYTPNSRPNFLATIYPWTTEYPPQTPKNDAPPLFVVCAKDDPLNLVIGNIELYKSWKKANLNASIHLYEKGGHGFGMTKQNLPSDAWIDHFYEWLMSKGFC